MNRRSMLALLAAGGALWAPLVGCDQAASVVARPSAPAPGTRPLEDIQSVDQLTARFTQDVGKPRLVLLVSPT